MVKQWQGRGSYSPVGLGGWGGPTSTRSHTRGKKVASLRLTENNLFVILDAPFDREFTETLKTSIPGKKRTWDAGEKHWYIVKDQLDKLTHILEQYYDEVLLLDFPIQETSSDAYSKLFLLKGAPIQLIKAAYKALSMIYHPDRGGDPDRMTDINVAYEELMKGYTNGQE